MNVIRALIRDPTELPSPFLQVRTQWEACKREDGLTRP